LYYYKVIDKGGGNQWSIIRLPFTGALRQKRTDAFVL